MDLLLCWWGFVVTARYGMAADLGGGKTARDGGGDLGWGKRLPAASAAPCAAASTSPSPTRPTAPTGSAVITTTFPLPLPPPAALRPPAFAAGLLRRHPAPFDLVARFPNRASVRVSSRACGVSVRAGFVGLRGS